MKKFGRDFSEPEMVLEIMGRHDGWAVIVALVGGGEATCAENPQAKG